MNGQPITARTGIKTKLTICFFLFVIAAHAGPKPSSPLPPVAQLAPSRELRLAGELFSENNWSACRIECLRVLSARPDSGPARLLHALAGARAGLACTNTLANLSAAEDLTPVMRAAARCELADALLAAGRIDASFDHFLRVFKSTRSHLLLRRSANALSSMIRDHPRLAERSAGLRAQLATFSELSPAAPIARSPKRALSGLPAQWLISFYRTQLSPALGRRCSLLPSCSEYAMQALRKHGLLGLSIYADRAVRESSIVQKQSNPVWIGGRRRYRDPLDEHDYWMERDQ